MKDNTKGQIGFRICEMPEMISSELVARLQKYAAPNLSDGMKNFYTMDSGIRQMFPCHKLIGVAVTVKLRSGDNLMLHKAIAMSQPGQILVIDTQGCNSYAVMGELMVSCMIHQGVVGAVVDGTVRDIRQLEMLGMPVFARGTVCGAGDKAGPGEINCPIACGGVVVQPGDIIVGDENGVVVLPRADVTQILDKADRKLVYEVKRLDEIAQGKISKPDIDELLRREGVLI